MEGKERNKGCLKESVTKKSRHVPLLRELKKKEKEDRKEGGGTYPVGVFRGKNYVLTTRG